jgi:D-3-phosphoglycerate dehydrogenase / 2-oxoglutarate reductase
MVKLKVVVTDYVEPNLDWEAERCSAMDVDLEHHQLKKAGPAALIEAAKDADIVVVNMAKMTAEVIDGLTNCQLIIRHGIGYDNVDIAAATRRGILVVNVPDYCVQEVAEQALTLILACQRKLTLQTELLQRSAVEKQFDFNSIHPVFRMAGKTVGIVGFGRIGSTLFRMLQGFDTQFLITDPYISQQRKAQFGVKTVPFEQVVCESDIISVHVPLIPGETYHMFGTEQFEMTKSTAVLVNTSRGGVVNLIALDEALKQGKLAMAGIDVYEIEPPAADSPLLHNPKAICTPHISWYSVEAGISIRHKIIENIRQFRDGEPQPNPVNVV